MSGCTASQPGELEGHEGSEGHNRGRVGRPPYRGGLCPKEGPSQTTDHFAQLFKAAAEDCVTVQWEHEASNGVPFQVEELREVVSMGRNGRAVGLDLTSYELVKPSLEALSSAPWGEGRPPTIFLQ